MIMTTELIECERVAYDDGLAAGLAGALAGVDVAAVAPGRFAAVPRDGLPPEALTTTHTLASADGIVFLRCPGGSEDAPQVALRLAAVRIGVTRRLVDLAVAHLSDRVSGGEPLIRRQLVTGAIADAVTTIETLRRYLPSTAAVSLVDLHDQISALDWSVAMLFGASGYIADHPVRTLYVSALVANTWLDRGVTP
jgi:Acyl-CoA dehydrogenase, C-terminal domain